MHYIKIGVYNHKGTSKWEPNMSKTEQMVCCLIPILCQLGASSHILTPTHVLPVTNFWGQIASANSTGVAPIIANIHNSFGPQALFGQSSSFYRSFLIIHILEKMAFLKIMRYDNQKKKRQYSQLIFQCTIRASF